jgi:arylsulfatase A-like enzyme
MEFAERTATMKMTHAVGFLRLAVAGMMLIAMNVAQAAGQKPNVIFILADNVGYGDLGPYGGGELRGYATPRSDQLAREGLRLTQFLVEPSCTPSRAALMTGQYSIRNGLSLAAIPGTPNTLSASAYTMGQLFKSAGYATALFGKWHLGDAPESLPATHGFDEFYGIPPNTSWVESITVALKMQSHSINASESALIEDGPWVMQQKAGGPLERVKPFTPAVHAEFDNDLTDRSIAFIRQQKAAAKPFFLYLPFSMGHYPNLPSKQFAGQSRIGQYGDKMMEGDYHVGQILDVLKELKIDDNTIVVFASDNGPSGWIGRELGNLGSAEMGSPGPFRGELGEATEGAIRTFCFIRWPGHVMPNTTSYAMFSIMDFLPTFASLLSAKLPTDRPIDGVDQTAVLLGKSTMGSRESLLTFIGPDLVAVRWKQWRIYFKDMHPTGTGPQMLGGIFTTITGLSYPKVYNIEMDLHEDLNVGGINLWPMQEGFKAVSAYLASIKKYPNPPAINFTNFGRD